MTRTLIVGVLVVVCASCRVDISVDVTINESGSGSVTITALADAEIVQRAPQLGADLRFDDARTAGWSVDGPAPTQSGGLQVTLAHPFATPAEATALLADISGPGGPLVAITLGRSVVDKTTTFSLNGALQVTGGLDAFSDADLLAAVGATPYLAQVQGAGLQPADAVAIEFSASLPGSLATTTATSAEGVSWTVPFDGSAIDVTTLTEIKDTRNSWASPVARAAKIGLVVWIAISICLIIYAMLARRRRRIENQPWY